MSVAEIIAKLPSLSATERLEVQAKLDELASDDWLDLDMPQSHKDALDEALADYERSPDEGSSLEEVEARVRAKLKS